MIDENKLEILLGEGVAPPPWVDEAYNEEAALDLGKSFYEALAGLGDVVETFDQEQVDVMIAIYSMGASYGWDCAMHNGPMAQRHAVGPAVEAKRKHADERRAAIRAAWEQAAQAGGEVDVDAIAKSCGVSRATVYRAMQDKPRD